MIDDLADQRDPEHARRDLDVEVGEADDEGDADERDHSQLICTSYWSELRLRELEKPPSSATPKIA